MPLYAAYDDDDYDEEAAPTVKKYVHWPNGDHYYGDYEANQRMGKGIYIWANGDRYKGEFFEGKRDGRGVYIWNNGDRYKGDYMDNKRDGEGTYTWSNGDQFKGDFADGKHDKEQGKIISVASKNSQFIQKPPAIKLTARGKSNRAPDKPTPADIAESSNTNKKTMLAEMDESDDEKTTITENDDLESAKDKITLADIDNNDTEKAATSTDDSEPKTISPETLAADKTTAAPTSLKDITPSNTIVLNGFVKKADLLIVNVMEKVSILGQMRIATKVNMLMISVMVRAYVFGLMEIIMKGSL